MIDSRPDPDFGRSIAHKCAASARTCFFPPLKLIADIAASTKSADQMLLGAGSDSKKGHRRLYSSTGTELPFMTTAKVGALLYIHIIQRKVNDEGEDSSRGKSKTVIEYN